jgi:hypothetical protein
LVNKSLSVFDVAVTPLVWGLSPFLHALPLWVPLRKMGGGRSMDSLISPKGNQKKEMQYEQTRRIFLCFFGEYLMHIGSGLCNVNLRVGGRKPSFSGVMLISGKKL